jgi:hypothetical protein
MEIRGRNRRTRAASLAIVIVGLLGAFGLIGPIAPAAAAPPQIVSVAVGGVSATGATLRGSVNPEGSSTVYRFEYLDEASYQANVAASRDPFASASLAPTSGKALVGGGSTPVPVSQRLGALAPSTAYRYRLRASNVAEDGVTEEVAYSVTRPFGTEAATNAFELLDHRGWEMVSPTEKNGGAIQAPGSIFGGGLFQAAVGGGSITYSSLDAFGAGAQGAPSGSQYLSALGASGWTTANITTPLLSGSYGDEPEGVPYQLFSPSLATALLSNGERCRGEAGGECPVANPPLPGSGAPAGYRDYYLRTSSGAFESLLTAGDLLRTTLSASQFELRLVAATPGLDHAVLSSCAALAPGATEVAAPGGCDPAGQNLYEWSGGELALINVLPGESTGTPGATIGATSGAISTDGSRVYFRVGDVLYLREDGATRLVDESATGAEFEGASSDGAFAYILDGGDLYRYVAASENLTALTTGGEVEGVLGASPDGSRVFYEEPGGLFVWEGTGATRVAAGASASDWPLATGTARVSADGRHLLFLSDEELTGYPNEGDPEVFLYGPPGSAPAALVCVSCNPTGEAPRGGSSIPGTVSNGSGSGAFVDYKPRVLSADATRVFFDSRDALVPHDTNNRQDVYEWEAGGVDTCGQAGGCIQLISTGRSGEDSTFLDASADGSDAFFLTSESIDPSDPGSYDVYDTRVGGGFTVPTSLIPCDGDACQVLPEAPEDPTPGTLTPNSGNPPLPNAGVSTTKKKKKKKKQHKKKTKSKGHSKHKAKKGRGKGRAR